MDRILLSGYGNNLLYFEKLKINYEALFLKI